MYLFLAGLAALHMSHPVDGELVAIGAGLARSGSNSLKAALELLLESESVSLEDVVGTEKLSDWLRFYKDRSDRKLLRSLVDGYSSCTSLPGAMVYKELLEEFPNVKVILTRHPKGSAAWYKSTMETIWRLNYEILNATWIGQIPKAKFVHAQLREMYVDSAFMSREEWLQKSVAIARYEEWNAQVERSVPNDQLLIFSADQGWEPLCKFLGKPIPSVPFPVAHTTGENIKMFVKLLHVARFAVPITLLLAGICICWCCTRNKKIAKRE